MGVGAGGAAEVEGLEAMSPYVKVSKRSVQYSKGMPSSHCGICRFYVTVGLGADDCEKVDKEGSPTPGRIDPSYWCKLFKKGS